MIPVGLFALLLLVALGGAGWVLRKRWISEHDVGAVPPPVSSCDYAIPPPAQPPTALDTPARTKASQWAWDRKTALWMADAVGRAYVDVCGPSGVARPGPPPGITSLAVLMNVQHQKIIGGDALPFGYVAADDSDPGTAYVILRGTVGTLEWHDDTEDGQVALAGVDGALVHGGFSRLLLGTAGDGDAGKPALLQQIKSGLSKAAAAAGKGAPLRQIFLAGHSLGAGLAQLAAAMLSVDPDFKTVPLRVYTFGNPRTGNVAYANHLASAPSIREVFNHMNTADAVPQLPIGISKSVFTGKVEHLYQQAGTLVAFADQRGSLGANHVIQHYRDSIAGLADCGAKDPRIA
jgi:hypothetical protein